LHKHAENKQIEDTFTPAVLTPRPEHCYVEAWTAAIQGQPYIAFVVRSAQIDHTTDSERKFAKNPRKA
jgi:hypothetical protein